jgi:sec-independent protein translocase protein TatC
MSTAADEQEFSEDLFEHTRMSFWDHIEELRSHLWRAIVGFIAALVVSLFFGQAAVGFIAHPVEEALGDFYDRRAEKLLRDARTGSGAAPNLNQPTRFQMLTFYSPQVKLLLKGRPAEEVSAVPHPFTEEDYAQEKRRQGVDELSGTVIVKDSDLVKLWVRIEQPLEYYAAQSKVLREIGKRPTLATMSVMEAFLVYFKVSMYLGVVIGSPWIFYQLWSFVAAGLYPSEKKYVHQYLPLSLGLFLGGAAFCQFLVIPIAVRALLSFNEWMDLEPDLRLNEWLHFAILFPLLFGVAFQTPLVMFVLYKVGLVEVETYQNNRRIAFFGLTVMSMLFTVAPDAISMLMMMIPLWGLYEVGIIMCRLAPRPKYIEEEEEPGEEALVGI